MNVTDALRGFARAVASRNRMEHILEELEWSIDERRGKTLGLNFKCPVAGVRPVFISNGDEPLVFFAVYSEVEFDSRKVPGFATNFAMVQNDETVFGKWSAAIDDGAATFRLLYTALGEGLTPVAVKTICEHMIEAAGIFDRRMKEEGYL
ncbi:MAG TPA: hypothetical protein VHC22_01615 [Pirellulales bacterium]|nr:hypothetical protein [Pirellulales bacterium]